VVASSPAELEQKLNKLQTWLDEGLESRIDSRGAVMLGSGSQPPIVGFLFTGQGSPANLEGGAWTGRFHDVADLYAQAGLPIESDGIATEVAQPAIVTASLAGLRVLQRFGIQAAVAVGHSLGELTAYQWAGALSEPSLRRLAAARGHAMAVHARGAGAMASIAAGQTAVESLFGEESVVIAGLNSPRQTVISGELAAIDAVIARARAAGLTAVRLPVSHAFHSPLVADSLPALSRAIDAEEFRPLKRTVASTVTGSRLEPDDDLGALLLKQMTSPVRFMGAVRSVSDVVGLWVEVGPGHVLGRLARDLVECPVISVDAGGTSVKNLLQVLGTAFVLGTELDLRPLLEGRFARPFDLNWQPRFFTNPCELAPQTEAAAALHKPPAPRPAISPAAATSDSSAADMSPLELVRKLAAARAELPLSVVKEDFRLLDDLHLSSLAVGQLVAEAARSLRLPPPASPADAANATILQVAEMLADLARHQVASADSFDESYATGVDAWTRAFRVELVECALPPQRPVAAVDNWQVIAPPDHPLRDAMQQSLRDVSARRADSPGSRGVVICLPPDADEEIAGLLLEAARGVAADTRGNRFVLVQHGGGAASFARSLHLERPHVTTCVVDVPVGHPQAVDWVLAEAQSATGHVEAYYDDRGTRRQPVLRLLPLADDTVSLPLGPDDVMLVTGGGKGIAAESAFSLAKETGTRLALLGRSDRSGSAELAANLDRMKAAGIRFEYVSADVTDRDGLAAAIRRAEDSLGPVTAVLHGAGTNTPQRLDSLDQQAFLQTVRPKVSGLRNVLAIVDPRRLRLLVTFGSIIARTGMHGQADYAVANEWLTRLTECWQTEHPQCTCVAVEWSVWSGVGMGERLGSVDFLKRQGITPIPLDAGLSMLRRLLGQRLSAVGVVVTGRFGEPATLKLERGELPLLRFLERPRVHVPGVELVVEADLSADTDPYLKDHVYQGESLLPAVIGLEAMAQVAMSLCGWSDPPVFEQVKFEHPVVVPQGERVTVRIAGLITAPDCVEVVLRSEQTSFQMDHFRALCRAGAEAAGLAEHPALLTEATENGPPPSLDPERDLYGKILFQGGRFRRLAGYRRLRATECIAELAPGRAADCFSQYFPARLVLGDPGARDAALHAVQACIPHGTLLPVGVDRLVPSRPAESPLLVRARERSREGDQFVFDLELAGADGRVCERWEGLHLQRVGALVSSDRWPAALLGPYVERRLGELVVGLTTSVVVEHNGGADRRTRSDRTIRQAVNAPAAPHRRPDGKPDPCGDREVSAAHAGNLTMAVAGRGPVACDVEPVVSRPTQVWRDLLGPERLALADLIAEQVSEGRDAAATRIWAAAECLKKAGRGLDTPLVFRSATADNWVVLAAGTLRIAAWVGSAGESEDLMAFAVLGES
jgi:enediyne polyketide synthase